MYNNEIIISIIILNYNGEKLLPVVLSSLEKQTIKNFEVIIVDNGSTDHSWEYIKDNFPQINIIKNKINNFGKGNNFGIAAAQGKFIFILNNDIELANDCIEKITQGIKESDQKVGMWATKILNYYNRTIIDNTGLLIYQDGISRGRGRLDVDNGQYDANNEVLMPSGCAGVYRKSMLDEIGLFDEDFEFYVEDSDLGLRGRLAGWKCNFISQAIVYHMFSMTSGKYSPKKAFLVERNRIWLLIKNFPKSLILISIFYTLVRYFWQTFGIFNNKGMASKFSNEFSKVLLIKILFKAWFSSLMGIIPIIKKRLTVNKLKKINSIQFKELIKKYRISAKEITLKDY